MIKNHFKIAWRNITRNKGYTIINVLGLSLGVCACLVIYLIVSFELSYDNFHPGKDRIYRIVGHFQNPQGKKSNLGATIAALPITMRAEVSGLENVTAFYNIVFKVTIPNSSKEPQKFESPKEVSPIIITDARYFSLFKYQWLAGNAAFALNEPFKVVLSENEAQKYFGQIPLQSIIGKQVIYGDSLHLTVSGIVKDFNKNSDLVFKDFISFATIQHSSLKNDIDLNNWGLWDYNTQGFVKLGKGVTVAQIEKQFPQFVKAHVKVPPGFKASLSLQPLADLHFDSAYQDSYSRKAHLPTLYGLMAIAAFILIIAAINFINLSTAQSLRRAKEIGVRKVLGSSKGNLTTQFLIETLLVTIAAVIIAVLITNPILSAYSTIIPQGIQFNLFRVGNLIFLCAVIIGTSLLAGFYPAKVLSSYVPALSLKGQGSQKINHSGYLRKTLIVFQFTVSLVFIIGTVVIGNQVHFMLNKDLGFDKDAIITTHTTWSGKAEQVTLFETALKQIPGVQLVTKHKITPFAYGHPSTYIKCVGNSGEAKINASFDMCDENYIPLFGLKLIAGRNLSHSDTLKEFVINETCAKELGFLNPADAIGKILTTNIDSKSEPIVGVVKDFNSESLHEPITPFFFGSNKSEELTTSIKLATTGKQADDVKNTIQQINKASLVIYPNEKFEYKFFDDVIAKMYEKEQTTSRLMSVAMAIAIFISCMGLFGLATFTAQQRFKEIGIRKVLGASATGIVSMLGKDFLKLVILAVIIASPIAYYIMHLWLRDYAYRAPLSWWIFASSGLAAICIAFLTISFQSIKAATVNPVKSLRSE